MTACEPSFGVLASSTVGNVAPPSVERLTLTLAASVEVPVVHATVLLLPPARVVPAA